MNFIVDLEYQTLIILIFLSLSISSNKFTDSANSQIGRYSFKKDSLVQNKIQISQGFGRFASIPNVLLGITSFMWRGFQNNENEFNLLIENITSTSAQIIFSTTSSSSTNLQQLDIKYFASTSDEIKIHKIIIKEQDMQKISTDDRLGQKQYIQLFNHILDKKPNTKREVECFIIGFRQEFSSTPKVDDNQITSFFVGTYGDRTENQFSILITSLDQQNTLKWVNLKLY